VKETEESVDPLRESHRISQLSGLVVGISLSSYLVRELLVCWLIFTLLLSTCVLAILVTILAGYAGSHALNWMGVVWRVVELTPAELHLKVTADSPKRNWLNPLSW
jgi:hypothetical protein